MRLGVQADYEGTIRMPHRMNVKGLTLDPLTSTPIIVLSEENADLALPIWIGVAEANAIALELEKINAPRPMTHDLMVSVFDQLDVDVRQVVVSDIRNNTYYAEIEFEANGKVFTIDARPSDAIALALRADAPIYVDDKVVEKTRTDQAGRQQGWDNPSELRDWLEEITPEDFSKEL